MGREWCRAIPFTLDIVILVDDHKGKWEWLEKAVYKRLQEEINNLKVEINLEKTKIIDLTQKETFKFLGFNFWLGKSLKGNIVARYVPSKEARNKLLAKLKEIFRNYRSKPIDELINKINMILRGWVNYFRIGNSTACFKYVRQWVEKKIRRHLMRASKRTGFGWKRWSVEDIYSKLGLYKDYEIRYVY